MEVLLLSVRIDIYVHSIYSIEWLWYPHLHGIEACCIVLGMHDVKDSVTYSLVLL